MWDGIKAGLLANWQDIKQAFSGAMTAIQPVIEWLRAAADTIQAAWQSLGAFFVSLWDGIKAAFSNALSYITPIIDKMRDMVGWVQNSWVGRQIGIANTPGGAAGAPGAPGAAAPLPSPYAPGSQAAPVGPPGAPGASGRVETVVTLRNAPPGTTVDTKSSGDVAAPSVSVGYLNPMLAF